MAEYDFDQWSVVSFVTKKVLCVLIYGETVYIFCYTDVFYTSILAPFMGNNCTDF